LGNWLLGIFWAYERTRLSSLMMTQAGWPLSVNETV